MVLQIFIAIMALNSLNAATKNALDPEKDPLITRMATQNTEQDTSWSVSVWSAMNSAYNKITHIMPTPEEILREKLRNIVFPDGRDAAGAIVDNYKLPSTKEMTVNQDDQNTNFIITLANIDLSCISDPHKYCSELSLIITLAAKGNKHALSTMAWLFASGDHSSRTIRWPYINQERAALFREVANELLTGNQTQEEVHGVLRTLVTKNRLLNQQNKKGR